MIRHKTDEQSVARWAARFGEINVVCRGPVNGARYPALERVAETRQKPMAIIEFVLFDVPRDVGVYTIARSITDESTMQLRKRVANGTPLVKWDTDDFPLTLERSEHYDQIRTSIARITSCDCDFHLLYRISPDDDAEQISLEQLNNLLESDIEYDRQERD